MLTGFKLQDCRKYCHIHERKNYPLPLPLISSVGVQNVDRPSKKLFTVNCWRPCKSSWAIIAKKACANSVMCVMSYVTCGDQGWWGELTLTLPLISDLTSPHTKHRGDLIISFSRNTESHHTLLLCIFSVNVKYKLFSYNVKYHMSLSWNASLLAPDEIAPRHHFLLSGTGCWAGCESYEVTSRAPFPLTQWPGGSKPINIYRPNIWCWLPALCAVTFNSLPLTTELPIAFLKWDVVYSLNILNIPC